MRLKIFSLKIAVVLPMIEIYGGISYFRTTFMNYLRNGMITPTSLLAERITFNHAVCGGKPTIRNMRFTVTQVLELLAADMSMEEILADYPYLEREDIHACLHFAARIANAKILISVAA
jgi:uncharacterized protein (DUF433 family)